MLRKKFYLVRILALLVALLCLSLVSCSAINLSTPSLQDPPEFNPTFEQKTQESSIETTKAIRIEESSKLPETTKHTETVYETSSEQTTDYTETFQESSSESSTQTNIGDLTEIPIPEEDAPTQPINKYNYYSLNGYNALSNFEDGEDMQKLYNSIKALADNIHKTESIDGYQMNISSSETVDNILGSVAYPSSIDTQELLMVVNLFKADNPLYYWIDNQILYSNKDVYFMTTDDYTDGTVRVNYNAQLETVINEHLAKVANETSTYRKALYFHDAIIKNMDYANDSNGNPSLVLKDHNIVSAFLNGSGVCEAYAKAFQLLLNASNIDNFYVIGKSGTLASGLGHVWNLVQLDDGKWYYCDLTWDDLAEDEDGIQHNNFCVGADTNVNWGDDGGYRQATTFEDQHIQNTPTGKGENFLYELPNVSPTQYADSSRDMLLRKTVIVDDCKYIISGYNEVQLICIDKPGNVVIPPYITYNGVIYLVTSAADEMTLHSDSFNKFNNFRLFFNINTESVKFPSTIRFVSSSVYNSAFCPQAIYVDSNNPYVYYDSISGTVKKITQIKTAS